MTVLRSAAVALLVLALAGCRRDPDAWPPADLKQLRDGCPSILGEPRMCECFADVLSRKLPFSRAKVWIEHGTPRTSEYADVFGAFVDSARSCAPPGPPGHWPVAVREMFIKGCLTGQGATRSICECMSERAEQKLPSWEVPLSSFELLAGRKSRTDIGKLLAKEEYVSCFARDDVPWGDDGRERFLKRCETSTIPAEICPCYVDRIISTTKLSDVARSDLPGDAGALANALFERRAAEAIRACLRPAKASAKKKRR